MSHIGAILGLPGAGKSEFCRLARARGCEVLTFDELAAMPARRATAGAERDAAGRLTDDALADRLRRARARLAADRLTILDSFPKGRRQAELVSAVIDVSFVIVVRADDARCRERAMRRSPERFTAANTARKFGERRRQTREALTAARARGIPICLLRNGGDLESYRAAAERLLNHLQDAHDAQ